MARQADTARTDEVARVAYAIWEAEGRPDGRDHEHWMEAKKRIEEGRANSEYPGAATDGEAGDTPRLGSDGARASIATARSEAATPGPRDPAPLPPTNAEGFATIPSEDRAAAGALGDNSAAPSPGGDRLPRKRSRSGAATGKKPSEDHTYVRPAGRKQMDNPPSSWSKTDEEVDESFPASDPPGNY
jgi:Protein of unknown function (DUF2934)